MIVCASEKCLQKYLPQLVSSWSSVATINSKMSQIKQSGVVLASTVLILAGCGPAEIPEAPILPVSTFIPVSDPAPNASNIFCSHEFTEIQKQAQPNFTESETSHMIYGDNGRQLLGSLAIAASKGRSAETRWDLMWQFDTKRRFNTCSIVNAVTEVAISYHLPLWPEQVTTENRELSAQWDRYNDALRAHHCKHGKTGIDAAIALKGVLLGMEPRDSCEQLEADADVLARSLVGKYNELEARYRPPVVTEFIVRQ